MGLGPMEGAVGCRYLGNIGIAYCSSSGLRMVKAGRQSGAKKRKPKETVMDKLVLGWLLGVPLLMLIILQYLM